MLATQLFAYGRAHLAPYKMPRILEFVDELPKTINGKIRRVELRARTAAQWQAAPGALELFYEKASS